jgi:tetratricopeptide (TPR) repeat protein
VEENTPYLVMDYAPRGTLRDRHPKGTPLALETLLPYVKQVADALYYAHEQKLIHRDVKPENMLLGERGEVLLSDFGIATVAQSSRYQQTEGVAGTATYMAPEQLQGKPRPASDQFALGIVVYEWLTGTRPFQGTFTEIASQHVLTAPPPLRERVPTISEAVEQVVLTALAKDPHERFASVQAFANALEQASLMHQPTIVIRSATDLPPTLPVAVPPVTEQPSISPSRTQNAEQGVKEGDTLLQSHQYEQALTTFQRTIDLDSAYAPAYVGKGHALLRLKRYYEALAAYEQAMQLNPAHAQAYFGKSRVFRELKRYEEALAMIEQALHLDPTSGVGYIDKGFLLWRLGRTKEALRALDRAIEIAPSSAAEAYFYIGTILSESKRYREALGSFERAILLDPDKPFAYDGQGRALLELARYQEALPVFDLALRLDPTNARFHSNRGTVLYNLKQLAPALQAFEQAILYDPNNGRAWYNKGVVLQDLGRRSEAKQAFQKARDLGEK